MAPPTPRKFTSGDGSPDGLPAIVGRSSTAAERFRVRLGARVNERVIRSVNATRHIGWQEQQLVLNLFRIQRLDDRDFAKFDRRPGVWPNFRGIRDCILDWRASRWI
jgi:hypothetical protein